MKGKILCGALLIALGFSVTEVQAYSPKFYNDTDYPVMMKFPVQAAIDMQYVIVAPHTMFTHKLFGANLSQGIKIPHIIIPYEGMAVKVLDTYKELSDKKTGACGFTYHLRASIESEPGKLAGTIRPRYVTFELQRDHCGIYSQMIKKSKKYDLAGASSKPLVFETDKD